MNNFRIPPGQSTDWTDDSVYSNIAYPLSALGAWGHPVVLVAVALAGGFLGYGSAKYHATYTEETAELDVWAMLVYIASLTAAAATPLAGPWAWALAPLALVYYRARTPQGNFTLMAVHVGAWAVAGLALVAYQVGAWALVPGLLFAGAVSLRLWHHEGSDTPSHSWWHIAGGAAGLAQLAVLFLL